MFFSIIGKYNFPIIEKFILLFLSKNFLFVLKMIASAQNEVYNKTVIRNIIIFLVLSIIRRETLL